MLRRFFTYIFGGQSSDDENEDPFEQKKKEFYRNFPENPVTLPNDGSQGQISERSPLSTGENVKINQTVFQVAQVERCDNNSNSDQNKN